MVLFVVSSVKIFSLFKQDERNIFFFEFFFKQTGTKFLNETSLGRIQPRRVLSLSRAFQKADLFKEGDISTSQGRRGRSRRSRLRDFCSSTVLVLSRSFSRGRGRGRAQIRGKMILDAGNGPHHHRHSNKIYILLFPQTRARDLRIISRVVVPRVLCDCVLYVSLSDARRDFKYLSLCICARVSQNIKMTRRYALLFVQFFKCLFFEIFFNFSHVWLWGILFQTALY